LQIKHLIQNYFILPNTDDHHRNHLCHFSFTSNRSIDRLEKYPGQSMSLTCDYCY